MLRKSRKGQKNREGQSLVEFALMLPILLLVILGIIEAGWIIWAYITVQNSAREAARFAVTGGPMDIQGNPWTADDDERLEAIIGVARDAAAGLPIDIHADVLQESLDVGGTSIPVGVPGVYFEQHQTARTAYALGVRVRGQKAAETPAEEAADNNGDGVIEPVNHAGEKGLNVTVEVYYNLPLLDPIYNALFAGRTIPLTGRVLLQNEGLNLALGDVLPPAELDPADIIGGPGDDDDDSGGKTIKVTLPDQAGAVLLELDTVPAGTPIDISLLTHDLDKHYVCFGDTLITSIPVQVLSDAYSLPDNPYTIPETSLPGLYKIRSIKAENFGGCTSSTAVAEFKINVAASDTPVIAIEDSGHDPHFWPDNSLVDITIAGHEPLTPGQTFPISFGGSFLKHDDDSTCNAGPTDNNGRATVTDCVIPNEPPGQYVLSSLLASTDVDVTDASITVLGGDDWPDDTFINVTLLDHAPDHDYYVYFGNSTDGYNQIALSPVRINAGGNKEVSLQIPLGYSGAYSIITQDRETPTPADSAKREIASKIIDVSVPAGPFITVSDCGLTGTCTHRSGEVVDLRLRQHDLNKSYDVEWDKYDVSLEGTDGNGNSSIFSYRIPITLQGTTEITSFLAGTNNISATREVEVLASPFIEIAGGNQHTPGERITIFLYNHIPFAEYDVYLDLDGDYFGNGAEELIAADVVMDSNGEYSFTYDIPLDISPTGYDAGDPGFAAHPIVSKRQGNDVALENLYIVLPDLVITALTVPVDPQPGVPLPIDITVVNSSAITVAGIPFDNDLYVEDTPTYNSFLPPGEDKLWLSGIGPNQTKVLTGFETTVFLEGNYTLHGRTDTSLNVIEVQEFNNIYSDTMTIACTLAPFTDTFTNTVVLQPEVGSNWQIKDYGDATPATVASVAQEPTELLAMQHIVDPNALKLVSPNAQPITVRATPSPVTIDVETAAVSDSVYQVQPAVAAGGQVSPLPRSTPELGTVAQVKPAAISVDPAILRVAGPTPAPQIETETQTALLEVGPEADNTSLPVVTANPVTGKDVPSLLAQNDHNVNSPAANSGLVPLLQSSTVTVRDEFNSRTYHNQDGTWFWATGWIEGGESTSPTGGDILVETNDGGRLRVRDDNNRIEREVDLSAVGATSATLSFEYKRSSLDNANEYVAVYASSNGGGSWTELAKFANGNDGSYTSASYNITSYIAGNTRIRFASPSGGMSNDDRVYFRNVQIAFDVPSTVASPRVSTGNDDAEERVSNGNVTLNSTDLELIRDGSNNQIVGIRFQGVNVPPGAIIQDAYIQFAADESNNTNPFNLTIEGEAADNPSQFSTSNSNISGSGRPRTATSVTWSSEPNWSYSSSAPAERHNTPDLSTIVQETVSRSGWSSGNAMAFILSGQGKRVAESYEGASGHSDSTRAPRLYIRYIVGAPANLQATANSGNGTIDLTWQDTGTIETGFKIMRSPNGSTGWTQVGTVGANVESYQDSVSCGTTYYYRVTVFNGGGDLASSNIDSDGISCPVLSDPLNLVATGASSSTITVTWTHPGQGSVPVTHVDANFSSDTEGFSFVAGGGYAADSHDSSEGGGSLKMVLGNNTPNDPSIGAWTTSFNLNSAQTVNISFKYKMFVHSDFENNEYGQVGISVDGGPATYLPVSTESPNDRLDGVPGEWSMGSDVWQNYANALSLGVGPHTITLVGFNNNSSEGSEDVSIWFDDVQVEGTATSVLPNSYVLERTETPTSTIVSVDPGATWTSVLTVPYTSPISHLDSGLACRTINGPLYHYRVRAYHSASQTYSGYSNVDEDLTDFCVLLNPPSHLAVTATTNISGVTVMDMSWQDNSSDETEFRIERALNTPSGWVQVAAVPENIASFTDDTTCGGATVYYRIVAYRDSDRATATSITPIQDNAVTGTCPPPTPTPIPQPTATPAPTPTALPQACTQTTESNGTLTLCSSGSSTMGNNDDAGGSGYVFMNRPVNGWAFDMVVRLVSIPNMNVNSLAGLEVRDSLASNAKKVELAIRNQNTQQVGAFARSSAGGSVQQVSTWTDTGGDIPTWLRIVRGNGNFYFYYNAKVGTEAPVLGAWTLLGSTPDTMTQDVRVGMINASANSSLSASQWQNFGLGCVANAFSTCGTIQEEGGLVAIDAINYIDNFAATNGDKWGETSNNNANAYPGKAAMTYDGSDYTGTDFADSAPMLEYSVGIQTSGLYYVWILGYNGNSGSKDSVHVGVNGVAVATADHINASQSSGSDGEKVRLGSTYVYWFNGTSDGPRATISLQQGIHSLNVWGRDDGFDFIQVLLTTDPNFVPDAAIGNQSACMVPIPAEFPPNLTQCTDVLDNKSFEDTGVWSFRQGTRRSGFPYPDPGTSWSSLMPASFFGGQHNAPILVQSFEMPDWLLNKQNNAGSSAVLDLRKAVHKLINSDFLGVNSPNDHLYAALRVRDGSNIITATDQVLIATGADNPADNRTNVDPANPDLESNGLDDWVQVAKDLFAGVGDIETLAGKTADVMLYAPNPGAQNGTDPNRYTTNFYVDKIDLEICTTQPKPTYETGTGSIEGQLIVNINNKIQRIEGVQVWAYKVDGGIATTFTVNSKAPLPNYGFYNLEPGVYTVYAQYATPNGTFVKSRSVTVGASETPASVQLRLDVET